MNLFERKYIFNCHPVRNVASVLKRRYLIVIPGNLSYKKQVFRLGLPFLHLPIAIFLRDLFQYATKS